MASNPLSLPIRKLFGRCRVDPIMGLPVYGVHSNEIVGVSRSWNRYRLADDFVLLTAGAASSQFSRKDVAVVCQDVRWGIIGRSIVTHLSTSAHILMDSEKKKMWFARGSFVFNTAGMHVQIDSQASHNAEICNVVVVGRLWDRNFPYPAIAKTAVFIRVDSCRLSGEIKMSILLL